MMMEDAMRLQLRCHGGYIDLSQPGMQEKIAATSRGVCATTPTAARG